MRALATATMPVGGRDASTAIVSGRARHSGDCLCLEREPSRRVVAAGAAGDGADRHAHGPAAENPGVASSFRHRQWRGRCDRGRDPRRHLLRVRLCRRRHPALRSEIPRLRIHPGLPGAAAGAGHERAHHAPVLLAHPAADRARLLVGARTHARRRRRGRALDRRQHLRRHGGSAAVHPALSRQADARGIVHRHDRRHGRHRRHRARALRHDPAPDHPRRRRASADRLGARCAGRDPDLAN